MFLAIFQCLLCFFKLAMPILVVFLSNTDNVWVAAAHWVHRPAGDPNWTWVFIFPTQTDEIQTKRTSVRGPALELVTSSNLFENFMSSISIRLIQITTDCSVFDRFCFSCVVYIF